MHNRQKPELIVGKSTKLQKIESTKQKERNKKEIVKHDDDKTKA
jgi:hypothetical protein